MTHSSHGSESNGRVGPLLWLNTVLTALILPLLGFIGVRLWDAQDANSKEINKLRIEISIVKERQSHMIETDIVLKRAIDEHLKDVLNKPNP